jgi:hypothetical protein
MIVAGVRMGGAVDRCEQGQMETQFVHVWFIPLIPLRTFFVMGKRTLKMPLSFKSILVGYLRGWGVVTAVGCVIGFVLTSVDFYNTLDVYLRGGTAYSEEDVVFRGIALAMLGLGIVLGMAMFFLTRFFDKANAQRCAELSQSAGVRLTPLR